MGIRGGRLAAVVAAGLVTVTAATATGCGTDRGAGPHGAARLGFTVHRNAVDYPAAPYPGGRPYAAPGEGLRVLVPLGDCVLGVGTYANGYGYVPVNWTADASCSHLALDPAPRSGGNGGNGEGDGTTAGGGADVPDSMRTGWAGGGLPGDAVVPWTGGSLLGIGGSVVRQDPDGLRTPLAALHLPARTRPQDETADDAAVTTAVKAGPRLLIGGGQYTDRVESPFLFVSDDDGATVRRRPLPPAVPGRALPATPLGRLAVDGRDVVGFGLAATNGYDFTSAGTLPYWFSADDGAHWTGSQLTGMPPGSTIAGVLHAAGRWFAYGGYARPGAFHDALPLLLTSTDGRHWTRTDTTAMGGGAIVTGTVGGAGYPVLVGADPVTDSPPGTRRTSCAAVWVGDGSAAGWRRGDLGCGENPPTAAATLRDGRVLLAGDRDLWISRAAPGS